MRRLVCGGGVCGDCDCGWVGHGGTVWWRDRAGTGPGRVGVGGSKRVACRQQGGATMWPLEGCQRSSHPHCLPMSDSHTTTTTHTVIDSRLPASLSPCRRPQVGNAAFAAEYRCLVPDSWAVVNDQDPVTRIPTVGGWLLQAGVAAAAARSGSYCCPGRRLSVVGCGWVWLLGGLWRGLF